MAYDPLVAVHEAAHRIKMQVPQEDWQTLVTALQGLAAHRSTALLKAGTDAVLLAQGRAQTAVETVEIFTECTERVRKYDQQKRG